MTVEQVFREEWGRAVAILTRVLGDLELAEDAVQDAFASALERWPRDGTPRTPGAWIVTTARNRAIDRIRRDKVFREAALLARLEELPAEDDDVSAIPDDRLALVFTCCHPALAAESRVALTLREVGGLTTREIAHAFLVTEPAMAQRLVRAKRKIRAQGFRFASCRTTCCRNGSARCSPCSTSSSTRATPPPRAPIMFGDLCDEAIRLGKLLAVLMPDEAEVLGLLSLMLLQDSRRDARTGPAGELVLLEDQDRSLWDRDRIDEGLRVLGRAASLRRVGRYQLQAGIAAAHAENRPWSEIVVLYDRLAELDPSPIVELNRAVAIALSGRLDEGLALVNGLRDLEGYHLLHAARRLAPPLERPDEAAESYRRALELTANEPESRYLERRLLEVS